MKITPEQIYQEYYKQSFFFKNGFNPRTIKNFEKIRQREYWPYFVKFANKLNRNLEHIDYKTYITACIKYIGPFFEPKHLISLKGIKIYKGFIKYLNAIDDREKIEGLVKISIKNILQYCKENKIEDFDKYLFENWRIIPTIGKHLNSGFISPYFLVLIPNIKESINTLPKDIRDEYFKDFILNYNLYLNKVLRCEKIKYFSKNLIKKMNKNLKTE